MIRTVRIERMRHPMAGSAVRSSMAGAGWRQGSKLGCFLPLWFLYVTE